MKVEQLEGEPLRFHVISRTRKEIRHLVDFTSGRGVCSCEHYFFRISVQIRDKLPGERECWHISVARQFAVGQLRKAYCGKYQRNEALYVAEKLFDQAIAASRSVTLAAKAKAKGAVGPGLPSPGAKTYVLKAFVPKGSPEPF